MLNTLLFLFSIFKGYVGGCVYFTKNGSVRSREAWTDRTVFKYWGVKNGVVSAVAEIFRYHVFVHKGDMIAKQAHRAVNSGGSSQ